MPVPSSINDLSSTPGSNSPPGSESPSLIDDYLRAHAAFLAALRDGKVSLTGAYADPSWITSLSGAKLSAGSVAAAALAAGAVTTAKFDATAKAPYAGAADSAATAANASAIADGAVSSAAKLGSGVVTAAKLDGAQSGAAPIYAARAWVNFNGTGTVAIRASGNVSSITDNGVGNYTINFATAMPDANYAVIGQCSAANNNAGAYMETVQIHQNEPPAVDSVRIRTATMTPSSSALSDELFVFVAIFR